MKLFLQLLCFLMCSQSFFAQDGFLLLSDKKKVTIPFKLINNLVIVPVKVNGVPLSFLLDTGVEETVLFSLDEKDEVKLFEVEKIKLKGLGSEAPIEALRSSKNTLSMPGLEIKNHEILIVLDQEFNFSSSMGIPVNGIVGYHFFKNNLVEIDYAGKKIHVYSQNKIQKSRLLKRFQPVKITIENAKPYLETFVTIDQEQIKAKCLIDTGNSDAVWLFSSKSDQISIPNKNFIDFLGRGFSGEVHGNRARISSIAIEGFKFQKPITSFPDSISIASVKIVKDRLGSIGGELLKRFTVVFDYKDSMLYLKKNRAYNETFKYNISGLDVHHVGLQWINEEISLRTNLVSSSQANHYIQKETPDFKYNFLLKPVYEIVNVRKGSPAEKAGLLKGDVIFSINKKHAYKLSLQQISALLKGDPGEYIFIEIKRKDKTINFRFQLEELL